MLALDVNQGCNRGGSVLGFSHLSIPEIPKSVTFSNLAFGAKMTQNQSKVGF